MVDFEKIRVLLQRVPKPPGELLPEPATDEKLDSFEKRSGIKLPIDLRKWFKVTNGPCVGPGGLYGIENSQSHLDIEYYLALFPSWKSRKWIPVAGDGCGNYYIVPTQEEYGAGYPVVFVDTSVASENPAYIVASDIGHFLELLLEAELGRKGWPFDMNFMIKVDPEITRFRNVPLPWAIDE